MTTFPPRPLEQGDPDRFPAPDPPKHLGRHHFARCGEYRPVMGNHECLTCPDVCPGCGAAYVRPAPRYS